VRHELGDEGVAELLAAAGETRSAEELTDVTSRSSYDQFRRPLEAAGALVGGLDRLVEAGAFIDLSMAQLVAAVHELGSIDEY
jgi:hypothetical protein